MKHSKQTKNESTLLSFLRNSFAEIHIDSNISRYVIQILFSATVGALAGLGAILFHYIVEEMRVFFTSGPFMQGPDRPSLLMVIVPVAGAIVVAGATAMFPGTAKEKGVVSVIKALLIKNGVIPIKNTVFHMFVSAVSIGTGAPLGPEGPVAKIGSGIGSALSRWFALNRETVKVYTAAGAGAAISAVFNAPIAGVFFAIEVILLNDLKSEALSFLIIASIVADIISRAAMGNAPIFSFPDYPAIRFADFPWFLLLSLLCGLLSLLYFGLSKTIKHVLSNVFSIKNPFLRLLPVALLFGITLLRFDDIFGIGYSTMEKVLNNALPASEVAWLMALRVLFLALFLQAGAYGGTFAPAIGIGAMFGFLFSTTMNILFGTSLDPVAFSLVAMGGVLAGINFIPLTSIMLVFELTRDFRIILPLMAASIVAYIVMIYANRRTVYAQALLEQGIDIDAMREVDLLGKIRVGELMISKVDTVSYRTPFNEVLHRLLRSDYGEVCVVDDENRLMGVISLKAVRQVLITHELVDLLVAADLVIPVEAVTPADTVSTALRNIKRYDIENIPVVKSGDDPEPVGILRHHDILDAYNSMLEEWETHRFLATLNGKRVVAKR